MSSRLEEYLAFARKHPQMFVNPPNAGFTILLEEEDIRAAEAVMASWLQSKKLPTEWAQVGIAFQDQYMLLLRDAVRFPDETLGTYIRFVDDGEGVPGVIVLPLYQGQVLLLRHFRHATRTWHLEVPRGFGMKGMTSEENAQRELTEEIGATVSRLVSLGQVYPDAGASTEYNELFYAEVESYGNVESYEGISELLPVSLADFESLIRENKITDAFTIAAYARAKLHGFL